FFSSSRRHTRSKRDWSSDVCSSDLDREDVAVGCDRPAEQREVVEQPLGDEAVLAVTEQVRLGVALGELLVPGSGDVRQVAELGRSEERRVGEGDRSTLAGGDRTRSA